MSDDAQKIAKKLEELKKARSFGKITIVMQGGMIDRILVEESIKVSDLK